MLTVTHLVGLDLGQVSDYSALVTLRREQDVAEAPKIHAVNLDELGTTEAVSGAAEVQVRAPARYYCNVAERFERGTSYTGLADKVCRLFEDARFAGQTLVVDGTGVGRPVVDIIRQARPRCRLIPVTITGGLAQALKAATVDEWGYWHVPKKELVGSVQVLLGTGRLEIAPRLKHAEVLIHELKNFSYKINAQTAHVSMEAWRDRDHDDLVLALALPAWFGERAKQELWVR